MAVKDLKKFDEICALGLNLFIWNKRQTLRELCLFNINPLDKGDLWLLSIAQHFNAVNKEKVYIKINFFTYLKLKYKLKFRFLRFSLFDDYKHMIDAQIFKKEIMGFFDDDISILGEIYEEYYRR